MLLTKNNLYRLSGDFESPLPYPTPLEFATFIVDESKRIGIEYLDIHFRPQWFSCPFCALEFDMIGSSEDFESDFDFFVKEHGLKVQVLKFIYSEKAAKSCEISIVDLSYVVPVKSTVEILQNFVAFSECMNFTVFIHFP